MWVMRHQGQQHVEPLGGKRRHCSGGAVHGGESDDPILALMRHLDLPVTREDSLTSAYLGHPPEVLSAEEEADLPKEVQAPVSFLNCIVTCCVALPDGERPLT
jgi:hypothetical protein